jgi:predicted Zn-dependent protease
MAVSCLTMYAQEFNMNLKVTMLKNNGEFKKGETFTLKKFVHESSKDEVTNAVSDEFYIVNENGKKAYVNAKIDDCFSFTYNNIQDFWDSKIITNVLYNLRKKGFQYDLRRDMEDDALNYIQKVKSLNLELNDPYLESYLYSLVAKIAPQTLIDGRPCSINLLIQQNPSVNACTYPNGTIVLNTGLLASLHSEDELVAVLAHEIAHFVLDHSIINVNKAQARQKRAEFWTAVATGITAATEIAVASKNSYYIPGAATVGMAAISSTVAAQVVERLGMNYNHEQEEEADQMAIQVLDALGYDVCGMATALSRIEQNYLSERINVMYFASYSHPALVDRIEQCGTPKTPVDKVFEKIVSFAVTNVAKMKFEDRRFHQSMPYLKQNIDNHIATSEDYILMANCLLNTRNSVSSNQEAVNYIQEAKRLDGNNINIYKVEVIAKLRQNKTSEAIDLLKQYADNLETMKSSMQNILNGDIWGETSKFISSEQYWANQMLIKLSAMN